MRKKITFTTSVLLAVMLLFSFNSFGQGTETFANFPETGSSYTDGTFTGQDGSTWNYVQCRGDLEITNETPCLSKDASAEVQSGTITNGSGIGVLNFDYMQAFSTNVELEVYANGSLVTTVTSSGEQGVVKNSGNIIIDIEGDFNLQFIQASGSSGQVAIDNVEWTDYGVIPLSINNVTASPKHPTSDSTVTVSADVIDDGTIQAVSLAYGTTSGTLEDTITMTSASGDTYEGDIPPHADETEVFYTISAANNQNDTITTEEMSYMVSNPYVTLPYVEDFETTSSNTLISDNLIDWTNYTPVGSEGWHGNENSGNKFAQMASYKTGEANETWLITPGIDQSDIPAPEFTFDINVGYWTHDGLTVWISEDFDGSNVEGATWTEITNNFTIPTEPTGSYGSFGSAGTMDLSNYADTVHIAFKYVGDDNNGETTTYQIDNVSAYDASKPKVSNIITDPAIPRKDDEVHLLAEVTEPSGLGLDTVYLKWGTASESLNNEIGMVNDAENTFKTESKIPGHTVEDTIFYTITAASNNEDTTTTEEHMYSPSKYDRVTINDIQSSVVSETDSSQYSGDTVITTGIVTATGYEGYFIQDGKGPWNGIYAFSYNEPSVSIGDSVSVVSEVDEYYNTTQLSYIFNTKVISSGNELPEADTITTGQANKEKYEGVFIRVEEAECIADTSEVGHGQWEIINNSESILVSPMMYEYDAVVGGKYHVTGIAHYSFDERKILPRKENDVEIFGNIPPVISNVSESPSEPEADEKVQINATITDDNPDDVISAVIKHGTASDDLTESVDMTNEGTGSEDNYAGEIPGYPAGTKVFYEIQADDADTIITSTGDYQVADEANAIIDEESLSLEVYPNPGNGQYSIEIDSETGNEYSVMVFNTVGKMVYRKEFNSNSVRQTINIADQNDGIYFLKIRGKNVDKVIKLIKE